jgi:very-short-patch-repair endonuclease
MRDRISARRAIAALAGRQHGTVAARQLAALGFTRSAIHRLVKAGHLHRVLPGVYAVGHPVLTWRGKLMAAVLWCGEAAVVSHLSAACLHDLLSSASPAVHVTVAARKMSRVRGVRVHQARTLHADDCVLIDGIPVTSVARTLLDLAETLPNRLEYALDQAERMRRLDLTSIEQTIDRNPGRRGIKPLRAALKCFDPLAAETHEGIEREFLRFIRRYDLPVPKFNAPVGPYVVDALWEEQKLIVEVDSFEHHGGRLVFESDRTRDAYLQRAGYRVLRITHRRLKHEPAAVARDLIFFLSAS